MYSVTSKQYAVASATAISNCLRRTKYMNELITKVSSRITHGNTIISLQTSKKTITISINTSIGDFR